MPFTGTSYYREFTIPPPCTTATPMHHNPWPKHAPLGWVGLLRGRMKSTTRVGGEQDRRWWEQRCLTCQKILKVIFKQMQKLQTSVSWSLLPRDVCSVFLWYGNAPIDPCWRTYTALDSGRQPQVERTEFSWPLFPLPHLSEESGVVFLFQQPLSHLMFFFLVLERNLFVFKSKINEFPEMAAMLLKVHMGRKCGSLQKSAWAGRYTPGPIMNNSAL